MAYSFLFHYHLLGGLLAEDVELYVGLPGQAEERILHVEFLELVDGVVIDRAGAEQCIQEGDALAFRFVHVIVVGVLEGVYAINGILDVPEAEIAPVVGLGGGHGAFQEYRRIRLVLVQKNCGTF